MKIAFTKKQYESLVKLAYLGNWIANAARDGSPTDPHIEKFEEIVRYIFSFAKDFGLEKYVEYNKGMAEHFGTRALEDELHEYIEYYNDDNFWDQLFHTMYKKDFTRKYTEEQIEKMPLRELFEKEQPFRDRWDEELNEYGVERLEITPNAQN